MKYIFLNLKRFDIPPEKGGVNRIAAPAAWGGYIASAIGSVTEKYPETTFAAFFPEAHIIPAASAGKGRLNIGCQGLHTADTAVGGPFGAFTTSLTGNAAAALGCSWAIIGHCEERNKLAAVITEAGGGLSAVDRILNAEVKRAKEAGLNVLYCMGEKAEEVDFRHQVFEAQLKEGLKDVDPEGVVIGYEPVWAIGPGKTPPGRERIAETAAELKRILPLPVVYGGGLKADNAAMLASIPEIDGGLIALTRFAGEIGFYPEEFAEIVDIYMQNCDK